MLKSKNEKDQPVIDEMVLWEPAARAGLMLGDRLVESEIPKGIGPRFIRTYGSYFDPLVLEQLTWREEKKDERREAFAAGSEKAAEVRRRHAQDYELKPLNDRLEWIMAQIAAGDYRTDERESRDVLDELRGKIADEVESEKDEHLRTVSEQFFQDIDAQVDKVEAARKNGDATGADAHAAFVKLGQQVEQQRGRYQQAQARSRTPAAS